MSATDGTKVVGLKYGCNPHQKEARVELEADGEGRYPFEVLNGKVGFINLLDALNAWHLVLELAEGTGCAAAASFKHVSPAGAAVDAVPLSPEEAEAYEVSDPGSLSGVGLAYIRARNADPKSSFGDFIAVSDVVDVGAAMLIKTQVSDGIIAPGYEPEALAVLSAKKKGNFVVLQGDPEYAVPECEDRLVHGARMVQSRNVAAVSKTSVVAALAESDPEAAAALPDAAVLDMVVGAVTIKYTQSNSVGYAIRGQMIGIGAGQQSRIDCTRIAGEKAAVWWLRQHPTTRSLSFVPEVKRQGRINARVEFLAMDPDPEVNAVCVTTQQMERFTASLASDSEGVVPLSRVEKAQFVAQAAQAAGGVSLISDAFFPFRDSIDEASRHGVGYILQPGGSVRDADVVAAAAGYGMVMICNRVRLFHH